MNQKMLSAIAVLTFPLSLMAQTAGNPGARIGSMSLEEFNRINAAGAAQVRAIKPTPAPLSEGDKKLMVQMARGGMMQLRVSQAALPKVSSDDARTLAQSEVDEQTELSQKLTEIASAKNVALPSDPAPGTEFIEQQIAAKSGTELDAYYVRTSGVEGHIKLEATMTLVSRTAKDPALKAIAGAALPLIRTHLKVSRNIVSGKSGRTPVRAHGRK